MPGGSVTPVGDLEEIMKRFPTIEVLEPPRRLYAVFVHGITSMKVRIPG